uniref:Lipase_3 domain-containing protein n=1 Tax=Strongyloides stercoralis TaxID=6248 RepID=A0A0K0ECY4_STRER
MFRYLIFFQYILLYLRCLNFTGEYNHEEAQLLGKICAMVSCFWDNECHLNDSLLYNSTKILVKKSTTYHFGPGKFKYMILDYITKPNTIIVVQKGTDNSFQLLEQFFNLYFYDKKIFYNNEKVWDYQFKAHNFYIDDLLDKINDLLMKKKYKNVIFTGHSLGGALSVLDAYECVYRKICNGKTTKVVTLGSPRTGDKSFAVSFNKLIPNTYRVVNRYDPITNFPNCKAYNFMRSCRKHDIISNSDNETFIDEFYHVGTEIWYFEGTTGINSNNYIICERHFDDPNCSRRVKLSDIPLLKQKFLFEKWHVEYFVTKFNKLQLK